MFIQTIPSSGHKGQMLKPPAPVITNRTIPEKAGFTDGLFNRESQANKFGWPTPYCSGNYTRGYLAGHALYFKIRKDLGYAD